MTEQELIDYCFPIDEEYGMSQKWEDILKDLKPEYYTNNFIYWKKNGKTYFEQDRKNKWLWCDYDLVWTVFSNKEKYSYSETKSLIKNLLDTTEMWKCYSPLYFNG